MALYEPHVPPPRHVSPASRTPRRHPPFNLFPLPNPQLGHGRRATPAPTTPRPSAPGQTPSASAAPTSQDDPILAQLKALAQQGNASAQAQYDDARHQALIAYGYDPALASLYGDAGTQAAAQGNQFSTLAQLLQGHKNTVHSLDENLNKQNLFYSGYRGDQLGKENQAYQGQQYAAAQALQGGLTGLSGALLGAQQENAARIAQAQQDAYTRALQFQLQYGGAPAAVKPAAKPAAQPARRPAPNLRNQLLRGRRP